MSAVTKIQSAILGALLLSSGSSSGAAIPFSPLPMGTMTSVPDHAPRHVAAGSRVSGLFVAQAPATQGAPNYNRIQVLGSKRDADEYSSKGYVTARAAGLPLKHCVFYTDDSSIPGDSWPALARDEIASFRGSGQAPIVGVHVETLEDVPASGGPRSLSFVDAWLDTRTRGLKLVAKTSIPLDSVATGPYGIRVYAARSDASVHFVVLPPEREEKNASGEPINAVLFGGHFDRGLIESGGEVGVSLCRHTRISLRALPGAGEHAIISYQHAEPAARDAGDAETPSESTAKAESFATLRTRLVRVHLSASRNATAAAPVVSVSFRVDKAKPIG